MGLPVCAEESSPILFFFLEKNPPAKNLPGGVCSTDTPGFQGSPNLNMFKVCVDQPLICPERKKKKKSNGI
jgi:hypothetical protein